MYLKKVGQEISTQGESKEWIVPLESKKGAAVPHLVYRTWSVHAIGMQPRQKWCLSFTVSDASFETEYTGYAIPTGTRRWDWCSSPDVTRLDKSHANVPMRYGGKIDAATGVALAPCPALPVVLTLRTPSFSRCSNCTAAQRRTCVGRGSRPLCTCAPTMRLICCDSHSACTGQKS